MLYYTGLEEIIFSKHELLPEEPDELRIISGYLGPTPVARLNDLPKMKITIIGGMYPNGIDARLLHSLDKIKTTNPALSIMYSKREIHSKIYIWLKKGTILAALIGSANFSSSGLRNDYRESLADATRDTFNPLLLYYQFVLEASSETPVLNQKQKTISFEKSDVSLEHTMNKKYSYDIPLYSEVRGKKEIPAASGLNWGLSKGHVALGDAYIRLPKEILKKNQLLIKPIDPAFKTPNGKKKRNSDPIELIWDDGTIMEASLEGEQKYNGLEYPKQLASFSSKTPFFNGEKISVKSILGRYLHKRLDVPLTDAITMDVLEKYGRDTLTLSLIDEGIYYADFSV